MPDMFEPPKTTPKIAVVGAGAMGSVYAGLFAEAGYDVTVVDIWAAHITAISEAGLRLEGASGEYLHPRRAVALHEQVRAGAGHGQLRHCVWRNAARRAAGGRQADGAGQRCAAEEAGQGEARWRQG